MLLQNISTLVSSMYNINLKPMFIPNGKSLISMLGGTLYHHSMARPQVADGKVPVLKGS
jgi:hypothetical protein